MKTGKLFSISSLLLLMLFVCSLGASAQPRSHRSKRHAWRKTRAVRRVQRRRVHNRRQHRLYAKRQLRKARRYRRHRVWARTQRRVPVRRFVVINGLRYRLVNGRYFRGGRQYVLQDGQLVPVNSTTY